MTSSTDPDSPLPPQLPALPVTPRSAYLPPPQHHQVTVVFFENPHCFYIVRNTNVCLVDWMEFELEKMEKVIGASKPIKDPEVGELYVTRCPEDDLVSVFS